MHQADALTHRKKPSPSCLESNEDSNITLLKKLQGSNNPPEEPHLTLMEEVLLLGLKDKEGYTSFWNDSISFGLRACVLVELSLRGRIKLEEIVGRRRSLLTRKVVVAYDEPTGDILMDETLKLISSLTPRDTVKNWIEYLSGESWNLLKYRYQLRNVRERVAKNLVEKGILTNSKKSFLFFDITTHPLIDTTVKSNTMKKIQDFLLEKWINDPQRMDKRLLALILLARESEVLDNTLSELSDEQFAVANRRIDELKCLDFQAQYCLSNSADVMWSVLQIITK